ncbi:acyl carrier protein [Kibdelosporangium aridum]|uniref:Acyl carrier protein n=1 Tax=Kibdelosporangium aridum TaxID=2030 RepID=A0A428Z4S8_KIBAR|nr:acyl carrier protein [Kibdelosporangium aridum]RSM81629.1 acyl carrier protein [Kibdelosporangium aridum]
MPLITLRELQDIMRECAGEDESVQSFEQAPDTTFEDLGYDSLALLETHSRIKRDYGVELSDDEVTVFKTPKELADLVNTQLSAV